MGQGFSFLSSLPPRPGPPLSCGYDYRHIRPRKIPLFAIDTSRQKLRFWAEKWVWILFPRVHSGGIICRPGDTAVTSAKPLNDCRSCRSTRGTNSRNPLCNQDLSIVGRVGPDTKILCRWCRLSPLHQRSNCV